MSSIPSNEAQAMLDALQRAVDKALQRKKRLGEYAVVWQDGRPVILQPEDIPNTGVENVGSRYA